LQQLRQQQVAAAAENIDTPMKVFDFLKMQSGCYRVSLPQLFVWHHKLMLFDPVWRQMENVCSIGMLFEVIREI
jgi:hypothetical protein